ncbi:MAG TPA: tRNA (adenosine(37)-N6)-threonylcarbamoyltransferase complex dimerization subunit type 1 TsaB [Candidatus Saccharimonadales bacterium]|nr:tRNA (adenosine(37)-N6)-threonylcarbamoyltransferase complex dimerization subunit type 1 TsaB [Candidatus Saccharimonadales bacterium]
MIILTIRTDKPEAELGVYENEKQLAYETWHAHRELAETIHQKIEEILNKSSKSPQDIQGIVVFKGPGSFTGLRIGLSVANALAYSLSIPITGSDSGAWIAQGVSSLKANNNDKIALPEYGAPAHVTAPKK